MSRFLTTLGALALQYLGHVLAGLGLFAALIGALVSVRWLLGAGILALGAGAYIGVFGQDLEK